MSRKNVIEFSDNDEAYCEWLDENPDGFVFNHFGKSIGIAGDMNLVHCASCPSLRRPADEGRRTTRYGKHVHTNLDNLVAHVIELRKYSWDWCKNCFPMNKHNGISVSQYRKILADVRTFHTAAHHVNQLDLSGSGSLYDSLVLSKNTVSHFNLGIAIELRLKCFLALRGVPVPKTHNLTFLYDVLPLEISKKLNDMFKPDSIELLAFTTSLSVQPPDKPTEKISIEGLRGMCKYFDNMVGIAEIRYAWEKMIAGRWEFYLRDFTPVLDFLQKSEKLQNSIASEFWMD